MLLLHQILLMTFYCMHIINIPDELSARHMNGFPKGCDMMSWPSIVKNKSFTCSCSNLWEGSDHFCVKITVKALSHERG